MKGCSSSPAIAWSPGSGTLKPAGNMKRQLLRSRWRQTGLRGFGPTRVSTSPFPRVLEGEEWLKLFATDALRYPILVVLGPSRAGKTEWAKSLFKRPLELKIGALEFFPDTLHHLQRGLHDGLVLDDVRDLAFLVNHQEKLQGKYGCLLEFGPTVAELVRTILTCLACPLLNYSTKHSEHLESHDWLTLGTGLW